MKTYGSSGVMVKSLLWCYFIHKECLIEYAYNYVKWRSLIDSVRYKYQKCSHVNSRSRTILTNCPLIITRNQVILAHNTKQTAHFSSDTISFDHIFNHMMITHTFGNLRVITLSSPGFWMCYLHRIIRSSCHCYE